MTETRKYKVACVQATPVIFDIEKSVEKVITLTREAAEPGCKLVVFPETFIPGYPAGLGFGTVVGSRTQAGRDQFKEYWQNSVEVPGVYTDRLAECAKKNGVYLAVGVTDLDELVAGRMDFDVTGHYSRNDIFELKVKDQPAIKTV